MEYVYLAIPRTDIICGPVVVRCEMRPIGDGFCIIRACGRITGELIIVGPFGFCCTWRCLCCFCCIGTATIFIVGPEIC